MQFVLCINNYTSDHNYKSVIKSRFIYNYNYYHNLITGLIYSVLFLLRSPKEYLYILTLSLVGLLKSMFMGKHEMITCIVRWSECPTEHNTGKRQHTSMS